MPSEVLRARAEPLPLAERLARVPLEDAIRDRFQGGAKEGVLSLKDPLGGGLCQSLRLEGVERVLSIGDDTHAVMSGRGADPDGACVEIRLPILAQRTYLFDFTVSATSDGVLYPHSYAVDVLESSSSDAELLHSEDDLPAPGGHVVTPYLSAQARDAVTVRLFANGGSGYYWSFYTCTVTRSA